MVEPIPTKYMSVYLLPTSLEDELQKMMNSFGNIKGATKGINWLN